MSQLSSRETSDMDIDDESFDQASQHVKSPIAYSHVSLNSDTGTASAKSVNGWMANDKDSHDYDTDEASYLYEELYENDQRESSVLSHSDTHSEEEEEESFLIEDMSIDAESYLEAKENVSSERSTDITTSSSVKKEYSRQKRLYQK